MKGERLKSLPAGDVEANILERAPIEGRLVGLVDHEDAVALPPLPEEFSHPLKKRLQVLFSIAVRNADCQPRNGHLDSPLP